MKQAKKRLLSLILCVAAVLSLFLTVAEASGAARTCSEGEIIGDASGTYEFYVTTGKKWTREIKLSQTQAKLTRDAWDDCERTEDTYGSYHIKVYKRNGDEYEFVKGYEWEDKSQTISGFNSNSKYKIELVPYTIDEIADAHPVKYSAYRSFRKSNWGSMYWESYPQWSISSSKGIDSFEFSFTCP